MNVLASLGAALSSASANSFEPAFTGVSLNEIAVDDDLTELIGDATVT